MREEIGRGFVHPVDVLEHEKRRGRKQAGEQLGRDLLEALSPEARLEVRHLHGLGQLDVEEGTDEREPRREPGASRSARRRRRCATLAEDSSPRAPTTSRIARRNG